jgi:hypothetical protein
MLCGLAFPQPKQWLLGAGKTLRVIFFDMLEL